MILELITLAQVLIAFAIAYIVLPLVVLPRPESARSTLDALVTNLLRWVALVIVVSHLLALVGLYNGVVIGTMIVATAWFARFRRELGGMPGLLQRFWPAGDEPPRGHRVRRRKLPVKVRLLGGLLALPIVALIGFSYWLRARDAFETLTLSPPDAYIHMTWAMSFPANNIWPDGVYPQGLAAFVAFINLFAPFTHSLDVVRYVGPLIATLLVFAIYYAVVRLTRNPAAAIVAAGAFGLFSAAPEWRLPWHRQVGILPQEFGLVLAILALPVAVLAVTDRGGGASLKVGSGARIALGGSVITVAAAGLAIGMSHPIPGAAFVLIVGVGALAAVVGMRGRLPYALGVGVAAVGGIIVGFAVVPLAEWLGPGAYLGDRSVDRLAGAVAGVTDPIGELAWFFGDVAVLGHSWLSIAAGASALVGVATGVALTLSPKSRSLGSQILAVSAVGLAIAVLWDVRLIGRVIPSYYVYRLGNNFAPLLAIGLGAGFAALTPLLRAPRSLRTPAIALAVGVVALGGVAVSFPADALDPQFERETIEYEEMARVTQQIRKETDRQTYTVVGLPHQRQTIAGDGFFIALWVFARDAPDVDPDDILPVPTPITYVFVELDPLEIVELDAPGPTEEYYFNQEKRGRIMATVYAWAEERREIDPDTTIYYSGEHVRVYRIARNPAIRVDVERTEHFQDYTFRRGELFNDGPTSPREIQTTGTTS